MDALRDMYADAGLGYRKEEANYNYDNNQRPDVMAANIVNGKSNRSQMAIDVSVANTMLQSPLQIPRRVIKASSKWCIGPSP